MPKKSFFMGSPPLTSPFFLSKRNGDTQICVKSVLSAKYLCRRGSAGARPGSRLVREAGVGGGGGGGLTGQGKKKEPRDGKWSASNPKVDNLNGFVDMTGTLLKIGSDNTYLD